MGFKWDIYILMHFLIHGIFISSLSRELFLLLSWRALISQVCVPEVHVCGLESFLCREHSKYSKCYGTTPEPQATPPPRLNPQGWMRYPALQFAYKARRDRDTAAQTPGQRGINTCKVNVGIRDPQEP